MSLPNPSFDAVSTHTLQNYRKQLIENLMGQQALFWQLRQRSLITEDQGGRSIVVPLMYGKNTTVKSYRGYDLLDTTPQQGFTNVEFPWKYVAGSVTISGQEEFENSGDKNKVFNLLDGKLKQLELSFQLELNKMLYGDGSGNDNKDIQGLKIAVEDGTAWSTYGGIDSSVHTFWRNKFIDFTGSGNTSFNTVSGKSVEGFDVMRRMRNLVTIGNKRPTLIVTTMELYEAYESNLEGDKLRFTNTKMNDAGFSNLTFSDVPIIYDADIEANTMLFLTADFLKLVNGKGRNFVTSPFQRPPNQDAKVAQTLLTANVVTSKRDQHGRIVNFVP